MASHENKQCMTANVTSLWQPSSNKSIRLQMIHITETYSLTDCLYLCSIKPAVTQTGLVISWHQHAQKHTAESDSHKSEYNSLILTNQDLMWTSSWCCKVERWLIPVFQTSEKVVNRSIRELILNSSVETTTTDTPSRNMLTLVKFWTELKVLTSTSLTTLQITADLFVEFNYLSSSQSCVHIID